jgi:uncharacterized membrane protein YeaQ/YmgE (transglycosylase-associated protein family)
MNLESLLAYILFGLIAGIIAKVLVPGRDPGGLIVTTLIGIAGAIIGGAVGNYLGYGSVSGFDLQNLNFSTFDLHHIDLRSLAIAVGGAILLLVGYRLLRRLVS